MWRRLVVVALEPEARTRRRRTVWWYFIVVVAVGWARRDRDTREMWVYVRSGVQKTGTREEVQV